MSDANNPQRPPDVPAAPESALPDEFELRKRGGKWLGAARSWLQWHTRNGEHVTWGSMDLVEHSFTVRDVEELASEVAAAAIREFNRRPAQPESGHRCSDGWRPGPYLACSWCRTESGESAEVLAEREACACEAMNHADVHLSGNENAICIEIADAIRARSRTSTTQGGE